MAAPNGPRDLSSFDPRAYDYLLSLAKPGFAWEFARRNEALRRAAIVSKPGTPVAVPIGDDTLLYRLRRRFREAERWGLYYLPDPRLSALEAIPFWLPEALGSAIGLRLTRRPRLHSERFDLENLPGAKRVLVPVTGLPELVLSGEHYAGYFALAGPVTLLPHRFFLTVQLGAFERFEPQLQAAEALFRAAGGPPLAPWHERAIGPKRLRRALIAWDVRTAHRGSHWDAARALYGAERIETARREGDDSLRERARRAYSVAAELVAGGYRRLLR